MRRDETPKLPALTAAQRERTRRSREALFDGGLLAEPPGHSGVPQLIERSWRRCVGEQVPVAPDAVAYRAPDDVSPSLRRAAAPVLDRLTDSFADVPVAMVLSDATGRIVLRHVAVRRQRDLMDRASAAEGFDYSEPSIGTNGIGTVLVERRPVLVRGPEHYNDRLGDLTCAGTPLFEPYTGRLVGSFSLACAVRDVHPLMTVLATDIGRQIEGRILDQAGDRHRHLVAAYLSVDRAGGAVLVVDESTVLANRPGLAHTGPELHPLLWRFLREHGPGEPRRMRVPLADGPHEAVVEPIRDGGVAAYRVRLLPRRATGPARTTGHRAVSGGAGQGIAGSGAAVTAPLPGAEPLHVVAEVDEQLATAVALGEPLAVTGPSGSGKLHTAVAVLRRQGVEDPLVVEPHLDPGWFATARTAGRGLVVRRVHETPAPTVGQLQALVATGVPVVLTADLTDADDRVLGLVRRVATTVRLPALVQHREHLPALVRAVLAELPAPASTTRFSAAAWEWLMTWHWPGDVAELRTTAIALARRARGGTVEADDLPEELRVPRRPLAMLESAEREAVVEALRAADGNRSRAASALGIGRNTLYRKMRQFGIT